ncbi:MAG: PAS domain S-box protein [Chloroflexi bacterium]|nr:PAS domain S-box protein [Chloroflexota bacterium]
MIGKPSQLYNLSLRNQFILAIGAVLIPFLLALVAGQFYFRPLLLGPLRQVAQNVARELHATARLQNLILRTPMPVNDYLIYGDPAERANFALLSHEVDQTFEDARTAPFALEEERALVQEALAEWRQVKPLVESILARPHPMGDPVVAQELERLDVHIARGVDRLDQLNALSLREVDEQLATADVAEQRSVLFIAGTFGIAFVVALTASAMLAYSTLAATKALMKGTARFGEGEISYRVRMDRKDELGQLAVAFNEMAGKLERTGETLRRSNELLEKIFSTTHLMIAYLDLEFNFVRVNQAYAAADERSPEFFVGKNHFELHPYGQNKAIFHQVVESGKPYYAYTRQFEYAEHPERGVTYWDWSLEPVRQADGKVSGLVFMLLDVTARTQAEQAVRHSEERLRSLIESSEECICHISLDGKILSMNTAGCVLSGFEHCTEAVGLRIAANVVEGQDALEAAVSRVARGETVTLEYCSVNRAGKEIWWDSKLSPVRDASGAIAGILRISRDITERKRMEAALYQERNLFIGGTTVVFKWRNAEGWPVEYVSPNVEKQFGYAPKELTGESFKYAAIVHPDDLARVAEEVNIYTQADVACFEQEYRIARADGEYRWMYDFTVPVRNSIGAVTHYHGYVLDITERKRVEDERAHLLVRVQRDADQLAVLYETARATTDVLDLTQLLERALQCILTRLPADAASVYLREQESDRLVLAAQRGFSPENVAHFAVHHIGDSTITGKAAAQGEAVLIQDIATFPYAPKARQILERDGIVSHTAVPLRREARVMGVLNVAWRGPHRLDAEVLSLLEGLADILTSGVLNARLLQETRRRAEELETLVRVSSALREAQTREQMLPILIQKAAQVIGSTVGAIFLVEFADGEPWDALGASRPGILVAQGWYKAGDTPVINNAAGNLHHRLGDGITGHVAATGQIYITQDLQQDPLARILPGEIEFVNMVHSQISLPLRAQEQIIGVMHVGLPGEHTFTEDEIHLLTAIADMGANALHRATLYEQTERDAIELARAYDATLEGWSRALELRDKETQGHTQRVTEMTLKLARVIGLSETELAQLRRGVLLHDIGKMGVPDNILLKPGPFSGAEREIMRKHPEYAYDMLLPIAYLRPALDIPYCHHERWDGAGYPRGLKGEQIPLGARLFAVVDVWDALRSDRPYRPAWREDSVREYIRAQSGKHFDPKVVDEFLELLDQERSFVNSKG